MTTISKSAKALVSVIVPNYNHARFLPQRLDSILAQTFRDFELIVLDDASPDNSREVLERYARQTPMQLVFNKTNSGSPFIQWRKGAELAHGKYLWIAESDDYADARLLETLISELQRNPKVGLAYCQSFSVDENNQIHGTWEYWTQEFNTDRWKHNYVNDGTDEVARYVVQRNTIPNTSAVLVRKDVFLEAVQSAEKLRLSGDWWTWSRVLMQTDIAYVAEPLNFFRTHNRSVRDTTKLPVVCAEEFAVIAHICSRVSVPDDIRRTVFHEAFYKWRRCFDLPGFRPERQWLRDTYANARCVDQNAFLKMTWFLTKVKLKRISLIAAIVRSAKRIFGIPNEPSIKAPQP
jgi:glycosyltransferase involved in cell wall biosynthesis